MTFAVTDFKSNLKQGGARPSLFIVELYYPALSLLPAPTTPSRFLVKGASIPASTIGTYDVYFQGKAVKVAGDRTFDTWECTIINDEDFGARNQMMEWMRYLSGQLDGLRDSIYGDPSKGTGTWYDGSGSVQQVSTGGSVVGPKYSFSNLWPTELGEIAVDWSSDAIQEYTIGFAYDHWTSS